MLFLTAKMLTHLSMLLQDLGDVIFQCVHGEASQEHLLGLRMGHGIVVLTRDCSLRLHLTTI